LRNDFVARFALISTLTTVAAASGTALALSVNAGLFCASYPAAPACATGKAACTTCHEGAPPALNPFGSDVLATISAYPGYSHSEEDFSAHLADVLQTIEARDSDGDGVVNRGEIDRGYGPGDAASVPREDDPGAYDPALALKRLSVLYCGTSPTYEQNVALAAAADKRTVLHAALAQCLSSDYWRTVALPRLADEKIRPVEALGRRGNPFVLGDYDYDYRLFVHILTDDRDARELLTADYHIAADGSVVRGTIPDTRIPERIVIGDGEPLAPERRAGMITTQWFIVFNTMFAILPRNTAAQAYRSYLGLDIAKSEGLHPVVGEPRDVDNARVAAPACAVCHSTLDPLAYPFSPYVALGRRPGGGDRRLPTGAYDPNATLWEGDGWLFGSPVHDLLDWARTAADSDAFKINLAHTFYKQALGREPATPAERADFDGLWQGLAADGWSANRLIHRFVDTASFGAPGAASAPQVVWKRHAAIARDLGRALELAPDAVCTELGRFSCTDEVFLAPLGGNDPFGKSQYRPAAQPTVTTPLALERVAIGACSRRAEADASGTPAVFRAFDLSRASLVGDDAALDALTVDLYRRLLGRDPAPAEREALRELAVDADGRPVPALEVAKAACIAVASTQEFAFL
jgi:hypothetical protein